MINTDENRTLESRAKINGSVLCAFVLPDVIKRKQQTGPRVCAMNMHEYNNLQRLVKLSLGIIAASRETRYSCRLLARLFSGTSEGEGRSSLGTIATGFIEYRKRNEYPGFYRVFDRETQFVRATIGVSYKYEKMIVDRPKDRKSLSGTILNLREETVSFPGFFES